MSYSFTELTAAANAVRKLMPKGTDEFSLREIASAALLAAERVRRSPRCRPGANAGADCDVT